MEQIITPDGENCAHETHRFRVGVDPRDATEFTSSRTQFPETLTNAIMEHVTIGRKGHPASGLMLQVLCPCAGWRNCQNPKSGGVMAVTHEVAGEHAVALTLFDWCCRSVDMGRKIERLADSLSQE
jgi:hypothetical protein